MDVGRLRGVAVTFWAPAPQPSTKAGEEKEMKQIYAALQYRVCSFTVLVNLN